MKWRWNDIFFKLVLLFFLVFSVVGNSQDIQVNILGGVEISNTGSTTITSGSALTFRIINTRSNCGALKIEDITSSSSDFTITSGSIGRNGVDIRSSSCRNGLKYFDFTVTNTSSNCSPTTSITIQSKNETDFTFTVSMNANPAISVLGGSPLADIVHASTATSATNGTFYGVLDEGSSVTRRFYIANTGGCPLNITSITSSTVDYSISTPVGPMPPGSYAIASGGSFYFDVRFLAPIGGAGPQSSIISIANNDNTTFTFNVSAEMFNYNIPGPGGITADFRLWLKSTRGINFEPATSDKVKKWLDLGTNAKNAEQTTTANQPTFVDEVASNINFNPVVKFENNGSTLNQYLYNTTNGFYSQDIFIVMESDVDVPTSLGMTIFSGTVNGYSGSEGYVDDSNEVTGVGLGNFTSNLTGERLWFNQGSKTSDPYYSIPASSSRTYNTAGIINARNKSGTVSDGMSMLYNSIDDNATATKSITTFENLGYVSGSEFFGTPYKIGKPANATYGDLNGRIAEIFTFAERVNDTDRQKIESYLAIKYGITLGASNQAQKNYVNSFGTKVWDITANSGFNFHIAGIGRDSISDLNQKQSKTLNTTNEVTIGLGGLFTKNSANTNEFGHDGDFLVWGCNDASFTGSSINTVTIGSGITTSLTRIDRKWKIIESNEDVDGDVGNIYVGIPASAFASFTKLASEEYVLIVADNSNISNSDIIDVVPLKILLDPTGAPILDKNGSQLYQTWYEFHETNYFTFGKAPKLSQSSSMSIGSGNYLVGEYALNLNVNEFTISSWIKCSTSNVVTRTILSKGSKLQLRLNSAHKIEVMVDDDITPKYTSTMALTDNKWHQITFVFNRGTVFLYIDGLLDKSVQNIEAPTPNYNRFTVGAVFIDRNNVINPLLGEIDEVYVWDFALNENHVKYLMNQEVERYNISGTDYVNGKTLPQSSLSNVVASIPWSSLKAHYNFNNFYGSTTEGQTNNRLFLRLNYLNKSKTLQSDQTAPIPYISQVDGAWGNAGTWLNNSSQNSPNSLSLDGVNYIDWNIVQTTHNITSGDKNISVLALLNNSGKITIADPLEDQDETNSGQELKVTNYLKINGVIDLVGESQLIQTGNSDFDAASTGYIEKDQQGEKNTFRFNDWSSPVYTDTNVSGNYTTIESVLKNGTASISPSSISFTSDVSGSISPFTLSTYWMYKYANSPDDSYSSWNRIGKDGELYTGEGFLMKGPGGSGTQNYVFVGKPNNGTIELPISAGYDYLVGNPYPSSIEADQFILDNEASITGSLYFWEHYGGDSHNLNTYQAGYATYNLSGGASAAVAHPLVSQVGSGTKTPKNYIAVGQGFFVVGDADGGTIEFNNNQRAFQIEDTTNSIFFKGEKAKSATKVENIDQRPKIRIGLNAPNIKHRQLLFTIDERATEKIDWGFDAEIYDMLENDIFWIIENKNFVIQGTNILSVDKEIPLGIHTKDGGLMSIKIDSLENISENIELFILDKSTNEYFKINNKPFEINLVSGDYLNRFALVLKETIPKFDNFVGVEIAYEDNSKIFMNNESSQLQIKNDKLLEVSNIQVFNYLGQLIDEKIGVYVGTDINIPIKKSMGVYFVRLTTKKGIIVRKIIMN